MSIALVVIAVVFLLWLAMDPKCPRCSCRAWEKGLWYEWRCSLCGVWFDPLTKWSHYS